MDFITMVIPGIPIGTPDPRRLASHQQEKHRCAQDLVHMAGKPRPSRLEVQTTEDLVVSKWEVHRLK